MRSISDRMVLLCIDSWHVILLNLMSDILLRPINAMCKHVHHNMQISSLTIRLN